MPPSRKLPARRAKAVGDVPPPATAIVVLDTQSPVSNLLLHDARKSLEAAEYLDQLTRRIGDMEACAKDAASLAACFKTAAQLRLQAAESLKAGQERYRAERTTTVKGGMSLMAPQTNRLLKNAQKAIEKLAEGVIPGEIGVAKEAQA